MQALTLALSLVLALAPALAFLPSLSFRYVHRCAIRRNSFPVIDISPRKDGTIMKQLLRRGDGMIGRPYKDDVVKVAYKISRLDDTILDEVTPEAPVLFMMTVGSSPDRISTGWDTAIQSMMESEIARFTITPEYLEGLQMICPSAPTFESLIIELNLIAIIPSPKRTYKWVGKDEDIAPEIARKAFENHRPHDLVDTFNRPRYPIPDVNESTIGIYIEPKSNATNPSPFDPDIKPESSVKFFDNKNHKVDPGRRILGQGQNHTWEENVNQIDISVPIGSTPVEKERMEVVIEPKFVSVKKDGVLLFSGKLHGKILPSQSGWSFADPDPTQKYKDYRVVLGLEKSHLSADLWATVLDREYMKAMSEANKPIAVVA